MNLRFITSKPSNTPVGMSYETLVYEIEKCLHIIKETILHLSHSSSITISSTKLTEEMCENHIRKLCLIKPEIVSITDNTNLLKLALSINQQKQHILELFQRYNDLSLEKNRLIHQQLLSINLTRIVNNLLVSSVDLTNLNDIYIPALKFAITTNNVSTILYILSKKELNEESAETCLQFAINYRTEQNELLPLSLVKLFNIHSPDPKTAEELWNQFPQLILNYASEARAYVIYMVETITPGTPYRAWDTDFYSLSSCLLNLREIDVYAPQIWAEPINSNNTSLFTYAINNAWNIRLIDHLFSLKNKPQIYLNASNPEDPLLIALHHKQYHTATLILKSLILSQSNINEHLDAYIDKAIEVGCDFNLLELLLGLYNPSRNITDLIKEKFKTPASLSQQFDYDHPHHNRLYVLTHRFDNGVRKLTILEIMTLQANCAAIKYLLDAGANVKQPLSLTFSDHKRISANTNQMSLLSLGLSALLYIINSKLLKQETTHTVINYLDSFKLLESHGATWTGSDVLAVIELKEDGSIFKNPNEDNAEHMSTEHFYNQIKDTIYRCIPIFDHMVSEAHCELMMRYRKGKLSSDGLLKTLQTLIEYNDDYNYVMPKNTDTSGLTVLGTLLDLLIFMLRALRYSRSSADSAATNPLFPILIKKIEALLDKIDLNVFTQHAGFINYINAKEAISSYVSRDNDGKARHISGVIFDEINKQANKIDTTISKILTNTHEKYVVQLKNELATNPSSYFYSQHNNHKMSDDIRKNLLIPMLLNVRAQPIFVTTEKAEAVSKAETWRAAAAPH